MSEYKNSILSDTGMCQQHGNFLPCGICGDQEGSEKNNQTKENKSEIDQETPEDRKLIEMLQKECASPVRGMEEMPLIPYKDIVKEFGTTDLEIITEKEKYKEMLEKGFIVGSGEERIYNSQKPGRVSESEKEPANLHLGVDFMVKEGTDAAAIADGEIVDIKKPNDFVSDLKKIDPKKGEGGYGNMILVKHKLEDGQKIYSLYGHLVDSDISEKQFKIGDKIRKGDKIGKAGKSFSIENGGWPSHLHFSILKERDAINGYGTKDDAKKIVNPLDVFKNREK